MYPCTVCIYAYVYVCMYVTYKPELLINDLF